MVYPLSYFVSAPNGTNDALILADIEDQIGSYAENLTSEDKLAFLAVLSRYSYFKQWFEPDYSIGAAITDTMTFYDTTQDSDDESANTPAETEEIWDILLTLEGISTESAFGLLQFITQQQNQKAGMSQELSLSVTAAKNCVLSSQKPARATVHLPRRERAITRKKEAKNRTADYLLLASGKAIP